MNINLLTIDSTLTATTGASSVLPKPDESRKGAKFSLAPDDNLNEEIQNRKEPISTSPQEFAQSIRKKPKSENPFDAENKTKPQEENEASGTIKQPNGQQNLIKSWLAEHSIAAEQGKESTVTKNELKAVLPDTPMCTPVAKKQPGIGNNTDKLSISAKTIAETKSVTEKGNTKELASELPVNTNKSTTTNSGKTPAVNINLPTVQAKASEMQPQPAGIDPEKPVPTEETGAKTTALLNSNGKETTHASDNLSENQSVQKLNIAAVQVSTGQTKDQGNSTSNKNTPQGFEQMLSHNTPQTLITEQTPAAARNATTANMPGQTSSSNVSADIGKQILESIHSSISQQGVERQITIRLNPPELGKVFIRFRQQDAELTGLMEVSKTQTRIEIEQTLPQIIRNLADSGIQIKRLEVMLSNEEQSGQGTPGNQSTQSGGAHQHGSANPGSPGNNPNADESNEWLATSNSYENLYELQEGLITGGSINMLI